MRQNEFMDLLDRELQALKIADIDEIIAEYSDHFTCKLADGYAEEEIALKLGDPQELAKQFAQDSPRPKKSPANKVVVAIGLGFADICIGSIFSMLLAFTILLSGAAVVSAAIGICLGLGLSGFGLLPPMPMYCAWVFVPAMFALAVLAAIGSMYCFLYIKQLVRAFCRWQSNVMAAASGNPVYPSLPMHPRMKSKTSRRMRQTTLIALTVFALFFVAAYAVCAISAGALGFWHAWHWFVV